MYVVVVVVVVRYMLSTRFFIVYNENVNLQYGMSFFTIFMFLKII